MSCWRKLPTEVMAEKWTGDPADNPLHDLLSGSNGEFVYSPPVYPEVGWQLRVKTVDGNTVRVPPGAYVVIDSKGFPYPCDAEIFEAAHERVDRLGADA